MCHVEISSSYDKFSIEFYIRHYLKIHFYIRNFNLSLKSKTLKFLTKMYVITMLLLNSKYWLNSGSVLVREVVLYIYNIKD